MTAENERAYRADLGRALDAGYEVLEKGGVEPRRRRVAAVTVLEDAPLFNAGKGAVFNHDGINELDAAIMDGATPQRRGRGRPARQEPDHARAHGDGDDAARDARRRRRRGVRARAGHRDRRPGSYFRTERRWQQLEEAQKAERTASRSTRTSSYFGTVGAVALDRNGNLAAATSTGGMTNKRWGRVGDSPIIGAGTYADNRDLRGLGDRQGRVLHPRGGRARDLRARRLSGASAAAGGARSGARQARRRSAATAA